MSFLLALLLPLLEFLPHSRQEFKVDLCKPLFKGNPTEKNVMDQGLEYDYFTKFQTVNEMFFALQLQKCSKLKTQLFYAQLGKTGILCY